LSEKKYQTWWTTGSLQSGLIISCVTGPISKTDLIKYAAFLTSRFIEAVITVSKKPLVFSNKCIEKSEIIIGPPLYDFLLIEGIGKVIIKSHVIDAFYQRHGFKGKSNAWKKLSNILLNREIDTTWKPSSKKVDYHQRKYHKNMEYWFDVKSGWVFIVIAGFV
jgi:hypothetical protein